jgi:ankyrin repeat protein
MPFVGTEGNPLVTAHKKGMSPQGRDEEEGIQFSHIRSPARRARAEAFFQAAVTGDASTLVKMLENGANPNMTDVDLYTALHRVVEVFAASHTKVATLLVERGGDVNASQPGLDGWSPLHLAAWKGNVEAVRFLLSKGADPSMLDWYGKTAADWALKESHLETVQALKRSSL